MCLCRFERTSFTNGNLKGSINAGRYTVDYLQCGNLPYLAWKNAHNCAGLSYRRIRRYLVWRLKRLEARDFSRVRIKFLIHYAKPITIKDNCWLASNVVVCGGVTIGEGCVIGAGSVVTRDIPPYSLAAGNPCRVIRKITEKDHMK